MTNTSIAGYAADYAGSDGTLCFGFGESLAVLRMRVNGQISGALPSAKARMWERITVRPVSADEASEILEMLDTPW